MSLKSMVKEKFINDVIRGAVSERERERQKVKKPAGVVNWRVLVVDRKAMPIVSSCCSMHEIANEGVTVVEDLHKKREPLPRLETIYVLAPTRESINAIMADFEDNDYPWPMYRKIYIFFLQACPDDLFRTLAKSECGAHVKRIAEINMAFIPIEQQIFAMDSRDMFLEYFYNSDDLHQSTTSLTRTSPLDEMAEQIATLCSTLGEYPTIRYRAAYNRNLELAQLVLSKLEVYKMAGAEGGQMAMKEGISHSQLIILDRGFDGVTPLLHELTYQAMAYDLLDIQNDIYSYDTTENGRQEVLLNEKDDVWVELRHQHIADVTTIIPKKLKALAAAKKSVAVDKAETKDLKELIQKTPQFQKELKKCDVHSRLAADCMHVYKQGLEVLCRAEQELATGTTSDGKEVKDKMLMEILNPILLDGEIDETDKLRVILLYIQRKKEALKEAELNRLLQHANISSEGQRILYNAAMVGYKVPPAKGTQTKLVPNVERTRKRANEDSYALSRWTPLVKDVVEDAIENKLSEKLFPRINGRPAAAASNGKSAAPAAPVSARFGQGRREEEQGQQPVLRGIPKLIVFIVGGVTYSEMRVAYEVTKANRNWDVLIGSTHTTVPKRFLEDLKSLPSSL